MKIFALFIFISSTIFLFNAVRISELAYGSQTLLMVIPYSLAFFSINIFAIALFVLSDLKQKDENEEIQN